MKVKELIEKLQGCNPEAIVVMSRDSEGNYYSPLASINNNCFYEPESNWSGVLFDMEEWRDIYGDEPMSEAISPAVGFWPTN